MGGGGEFGEKLPCSESNRFGESPRLKRQRGEQAPSLTLQPRTCFGLGPILIPWRFKEFGFCERIGQKEWKTPTKIPIFWKGWVSARPT